MDNTEVTFVPLPGWRDLYLVTRRHFEWLAAVAWAITSLVWREEITGNFKSKAWDLSSFYAATFDWSSIQAALLFGIYAFFMSRTEPLLRAVASSSFFKLLRRYLIRTLYLSMSLTVATLPMLVSPADIESAAGYSIFSAISALLVFTFFSFLKVVRVFSKIERGS